MTGIELIAAERTRQVEQYDWTSDHDSNHDAGELALAAACYALPADNRPFLSGFRAPQLWPWADSWWKPKPFDRVRELVKAGALIAAEIDRLQRAALGSEPPVWMDDVRGCSVHGMTGSDTSCDACYPPPPPKRARSGSEGANHG